MKIFLVFQLLFISANFNGFFCQRDDEFEWTAEGRGQAECDNGVVIGMKCKGSSCSNAGILCKPDIPIHDSVWPDNTFSEENPDGFICPDGKLMTGVSCSGLWCDNVKVQCSSTDIELSDDCGWWNQGAGGQMLLHSVNQYIAGLKCTGGFCAGKKYYVCSGTRDLTPCEYPTDSYEFVTSCSAEYSSVSMSCSYTKSTGTSKSTSSSSGASVSNSISADVSATLSATMSAGMGFSSTTGYNWGRSSSSTFSSSTSQSASFICPAREKCTLFQVVGVCGAFTIRTSVLRIVTGVGIPPPPVTTTPAPAPVSVTWNNTDGRNCDFYENDMRLELGVSSGQACSDLCNNDPSCTHFAWNRFYERCHLKTSPVQASEALLDSDYDCGLYPGKPTGSITNIRWNATLGMNCDFYGNDLTAETAPSATVCQARCSSRTGCTHFTWNSLSSRCFLKHGTVQKRQAEHYDRVACGLFPDKMTS